ncbi:MAG: peptidoglycan-binding protein [Proteobacteria bacterium]|nr:peptidoglycan-binding protein [Pseudomonadota bacterium]
MGAAALWLALPAAAQAPAAPLSCSAANAGQAVCQAEGICKCSYNAGGTMIREPPGYRWDCSLLYGKCAAGSAYPQLAIGVTPGPIPTGSPPARVTANLVRAAQSELLRLGYKPGPIDGVMGRRTAGAISAFQRAQRLPETGTLTQETLSRLRVAG